MEGFMARFRVTVRETTYRDAFVELESDLPLQATSWRERDASDDVVEQVQALVDEGNLDFVLCETDGGVEILQIEALDSDTNEIILPSSML